MNPPTRDTPCLSRLHFSSWGRHGGNMEINIDNIKDELSKLYNYFYHRGPDLISIIASVEDSTRQEILYLLKLNHDLWGTLLSIERVINIIDPRERNIAFQKTCNTIMILQTERIIDTKCGLLKTEIESNKRPQLPYYQIIYSWQLALKGHITFPEWISIIDVDYQTVNTVYTNCSSSKAPINEILSAEIIEKLKAVNPK